MKQAYDYRAILREDITNYIVDSHITWDADCREETEEELYDTLWTDDSVTGNGSGSYTFSSWEAEENLCHNLDLLGEVLNEFGCGGDYLIKNGAEACDVSIRCYLLGEVLHDVMDEIESEV